MSKTVAQKISRQLASVAMKVIFSFASERSDEWVFFACDKKIQKYSHYKIIIALYLIVREILFRQYLGTSRL